MAMQITKEQLDKILRMAYLGMWMLDAPAIENAFTDFDECFSHLLSEAKKEGLDECVQYDEKEKRYLPSSEFEEQNHKFILEYDNNIFWEELATRLAERDMVNMYGKEKVEAMDLEKRLDEEAAFSKKYYDEFEKTGINNIDIKE